MRTLLFMTATWLLAPLPSFAAASTEPVRHAPVLHTYALLVGSNPGGEGQARLRYAEEDARRMAALLDELSGVPSGNSRVLLGPSRDQVVAALSDMQQQLEVHRARGEQAQFVFYYSGHARANAIHLGTEELALGELRSRVLGLPTTLTLIVLDACQSGAFSKIKGSEPAAEFSYNSVARLQTEGVAVMASSSASELSQESDALHGSYFSHHLMVGLRGAADVDRDGVVSLAEAYRYAYDRTLSTTARTRIGRQHVTLETALTGRGEVALTYPARADAQLELPALLEADLVLERRGKILAELRKVRGSPLRLALPAGMYSAVLRRDRQLVECEIGLAPDAVTTLAVEHCKPIDEQDAEAKGYLAAHSPRSAAAAPMRPSEGWSLELTLGFGGTREDDYTHRLNEFGFQSSMFWNANLYWQIAVGRQLHRNFSVLVDVRDYEATSFTRELRSTDDPDMQQHFRWATYALGLHLRAHVDLGDSFRAFVQAGTALGYVRSNLDGHGEDHFGPVASTTAGLIWMVVPNGGFILQAHYSYVPVLANELGEHRNGGGASVSLGFRFRTWSVQ
jgi:hypothetical protein